MASDTVFVEPEELIPVVEDVRSEGTEVYFNFDIGHWFICADAGKDISMLPEDVIKNSGGNGQGVSSQRLRSGRADISPAAPGSQENLRKSLIDSLRQSFRP